ncbi:MAG TPA: beta-galactosidase GalA [Gemmatimonadales bacterium]|jgi:beta-galactosidase
MSLWSRRQLVQRAVAAPLLRWLPRFSRALAPAPSRDRLLFDSGWRFHLGHASDPARDFGWGAESDFEKSSEVFRPSGLKFDDSAWRAVTLPHDWAVELPYVHADELNEYGDHPVGRNYPETSIGWYRRVFTLPAADAGRRITLEFDGVFRDALIAVNGRLVGRNFSGYAPYQADITDLLTYGTPNVLVVRVDATEREGWFYEGAGIYRHVWLVKTAPLHVAHWGTQVTAEVDGDHATVTVETEIAQDADGNASCSVRQEIHDAAGVVLASQVADHQSVAAWSTATVRQQLSVVHPRLWSVDTPILHTLVTTILVNAVEVDRYETSFGIRTIHFDADRGFLLNGARVAIKGTCNHQDHAGVGSALPDRLQSYRIERLKAMGSNAYRTSHNPPTAELLDACDRQGMLVLDETRLFSPEPEGLSQLERMVRRDRNHPCVIAWSLANEEYADQGSERGRLMIAAMRRAVLRLDPTRPVTAAMNGGWGKGFTFAVDVQGFNYFLGDIDAIHRDWPTKPLMGTEVSSALGTRGIYANDKERGYMSAYDVNAPGWGATAEKWWSYFAARPFLAGGFVWTGFDYRGEPTPYKWPCTSSHFGIMDTCGFPKDNFYYYQAWWGAAPVLHLFPHWNWSGREGQPIDVWVHSNLDEVELLLNGHSLGRKPVIANSHLSWQVPYAPGAIEARGFRGGRRVQADRRETTGPATALRLTADRNRIQANGEDLAVVSVEVIDAAGRVVPTDDAAITFTVTGPGAVLGVGNGNPSSHEPDKASNRQAFNGLCCVLVQAGTSPGQLAVSATAEGLASATALIAAESAQRRPAVD